MRRRRVFFSGLLSLLARHARGATGAATEFEALRPGLRADRVVVRKRDRLMTLYCQGRPLRSYAVALGRGGPGPKRRAGDNRTPEGLYEIDDHNAESAFHLALHISYPADRDLARARADGVEPGGDIMVHGLGPERAHLGRRHSKTDWTDGCVAVTDEEIEEVWKLVPDGTPIEILP